jgi:PAS domain S-box-containing protein
MIQKKQSDETNALLAAVVASSMDAVFSIDANARIQTWNKAAERLYGYAADEAIGQPLRLLAPDPASYAPGDLFRRALHGEQIYFEAFRRRKDGALVEVGISSGPIRDLQGNVVGISVVHRDISERKRSERELQQTQQWLELAQEAGGVGTWDYDPESGDVRWPREAFRQLSYDAKNLRPSLAAFRDRVHPEDQDGLESIRNQERTAEPGTQFQIELRLVRPDGGLCWIDRRSRVVVHEERRRVIGVNVDITGRKKQEDTLLFIMNELSHRTKNILSVVQAMATQTARYCGTYAVFEESFLGRIQALAQSHDLLVSQNWQGALLSDLILAQLTPFVEDEDRVETEGPPVALRTEAAQALGIVLHELATNASKYGALTAPGGKIRIHWEITEPGIQLEWREHDGPLVKPSMRRGFGRIVIERMARDMFGLESKLELLPTGVRWRTSIPVSLTAGT